MLRVSGRLARGRGPTLGLARRFADAAGAATSAAPSAGAAVPAAAAPPAAPPAPVTKDVVIIGGGPAGLSLAAALKTSPDTKHLDVALVEAQPVARLQGWAERADPDLFENRVSSLTPRSVRFLRRVGAWDHVVGERVQPYDEMRVWDGVSGAAIDFDPFTLGENDEIAYMVENSNLQQALLRRLEEVGAGEAVSGGARVASIVAPGGGAAAHDLAETPAAAGASPWPHVTLEDGRVLAARLLVGADGQQSPVRAYAGIESRGWAYGRSGLVASLKLEYDNFRTVAYQRFLPSGPIALLPLPGGNATLVWSTLPERAQWLRALAPEAFVAVVNAGFRLEPVDLDYIHQLDPADSATIIDEVEWRLEQGRAALEDAINALPVPVAGVDEGTRAAFPLRMSHADTYIGERVALVGDAAHATHPLAGQGLNMGQRDVELLVDALETATRRGLDLGSPLALEPYWRAAYAPNHLKLGVVDKLHKLYSTDWWPLVQLRSLGLEAVNNSDLVKRFLMQQASN